MVLAKLGAFPHAPSSTAAGQGSHGEPFLAGEARLKNEGLQPGQWTKHGSIPPPPLAALLNQHTAALRPDVRIAFCHWTEMIAHCQASHSTALAYHQVNFVGCHIVHAFSQGSSCSVVWWWFGWDKLCHGHLESADLKCHHRHRGTGCLSVSCCLSAALPIATPSWVTGPLKSSLRSSASEEGNARKPNETIKEEKRETTLLTTDRLFPLSFAHHTAAKNYCCSQWLSLSGEYQRPEMFSGLNLESEKIEKCQVVRCVTAFKTTWLQGGMGERNGLRLSW